MVTLPSITVTIAQWGRTAETDRAVDAVRRSDYAGEMEILVYDNASPGGPGRLARRDDVRVVQGDENIGFGPAHDRLAGLGTGRLLLILNNDTVVAPSAIRRLVERYESEGDIGAVAPAYRNFDGSPLELGGFVGGSADGWQFLRGAHPPESLTRMPVRADYGSAACLLLDRGWFVDRGGFDDRFAPAYYEDTDLCFSLAYEGKRVLVEPTAVVYHYEGATAGSSTESGFKRFQSVHRSVFAEKWRSRLEGRPAASFEMALDGALFSRGQRKVLWMSPHLPAADREAGHARLLRMIRALQQAGAGVVLWAEHVQDADRYGPILEDMGVAWFGHHRARRWSLAQRVPAALRGADDLLEAVKWDDIIVSFPELAERVIPRVRKSVRNRHTPVLVDDVDLHFLRLERAAEQGLSVPGELYMAKERELEIYGASDGVIVASNTEQDILEVELVGLPVYAFPVGSESRAIGTPKRDGHALFLGNMAHDPNRDAVGWWIDEIGPRLAEYDSDAKLTVVGTGSERYARAWEASGHVRVIGWVEDLDEVFAESRIFVAPLRYGAGTKGKLLVALMHGLPIVTTEVGAEGNDSAFEACMKVVDDPDGFAAATAELMTDDSAWQASVEAMKGLRDRMQLHQQVIAAEFADWVVRRRRMYP